MKTSREIYNLFTKAQKAHNNLKALEAEYERAKTALLEAMQENGTNEIIYNNGHCKIVEYAMSIVVDVKKVKAKFPDWETRFGQIRKGYITLKW